MKPSNKPEDNFETVLFLPEGVGRKGEGGLRTKGYFKAGGLIPNAPVIASENPGHCERSEAIHHEDTSPLTPNPSPESKPLITVVTVVYNGEKFLEETILSVINQTYDNVEYIIIDGGSTDGTHDIIRKYEHAIDYWVSENDEGIFDAMNKAVQCSHGGWIYFLNAGDAFFSNSTLQALSTSLAKFYLRNNLVVGNVELFADDVSFGLAVRCGLNIPHQGVFIKTEVLQAVGFDVRLRIYGDAGLWQELFKRGLFKVAYVPQVITRFPMDGVGSDPEFIWIRYKDMSNTLWADRRYLTLLRRFILSLIAYGLYKIFGRKGYYYFYIKTVNAFLRSVWCKMLDSEVAE